jgi:hypothetical protein
VSTFYVCKKVSCWNVAISEQFPNSFFGEPVALPAGATDPLCRCTCSRIGSEAADRYRPALRDDRRTDRPVAGLCLTLRQARRNRA